MAAETIECKQCGGSMKRTKHVDSDRGMQAFGCAIFIVGIVCLFLPLVPFTQIIGLALLIGAARMGYKKRKVWKCGQCGYFFERAK